MHATTNQLIGCMILFVPVNVFFHPATEMLDGGMPKWQKGNKTSWCMFACKTAYNTWVTQWLQPPTSLGFRSTFSDIIMKCQRLQRWWSQLLSTLICDMEHRSLPHAGEPSWFAESQSFYHLLHGGFHKWVYPYLWMVYSGKSHL